MPRNRNGLVFFEASEDYNEHAAGQMLKDVRLGDVKFPYGFFVVEDKGKRYVVPGTKDDLVQRLLKAFPAYPVHLIAGISNCMEDIFAQHRMCTTGCPDFPSVYACNKFFDEASRFYGCACERID